MVLKILLHHTKATILAHTQLRINDALNRAAVSADGAANNASTYVSVLQYLQEQQK